MPALIQAGNPGSLFQYHPARGRPGIDQFGNLPLPHKRRRMRPGRRIRKQHLHIAGADILLPDLIGGPRIAGDPADNFQRVGIIEPGRGQPFGIVDDQGNFGKIPGRPGGGTGKNHILHPAAAHRGGAVFAHDPAQCLEQIGFATAIGPDNAGQPVRYDQIGRVDKTFEPIQAQLGKTHRPSRFHQVRDFAGLQRSESTKLTILGGRVGAYPQDIAPIRSAKLPELFARGPMSPARWRSPAAKGRFHA